MTTDNADPIFSLKREAQLEPFRAKIGEGDDAFELTMTHLANVDQFELARLFIDDKVGDLAFMTSVFQLALPPEQLVLLEDAGLSRREIAQLYKAYEQFCSVTKGESPASSS